MNEWICDECGYSVPSQTSLLRHRCHRDNRYVNEKYIDHIDRLRMTQFDEFLKKEEFLGLVGERGGTNDAIEAIDAHLMGPPQRRCPDCRPNQVHSPDCEKRPLTAAELEEVERSLAAAAEFRKTDD